MPKGNSYGLLNALSFDLEDWFCVNSFKSVIKKKDWDTCELRVETSTRKILKILDTHNIKATFFVLGWIAERCADLILEIENSGHEIATHGYSHVMLTKMTPGEFGQDIKKSIDVLKKIGIKHDIIGYRAPNFTIVKETQWALKILEDNGIKYDSSMFPMNLNPDYGITGIPLKPFFVTDNLIEFPISCAEFFGKRLPCGGAYFRLFPYLYTKFCIKKFTNTGNPFMFYLHPWELDPEHPKIKLSFIRQFGHYCNLNKTEKRLNKLITDFKFTTIRDVLNI